MGSAPGWRNQLPRAAEIGLIDNRVRTRPLAAEGRLTLNA